MIKRSFIIVCIFSLLIAVIGFLVAVFFFGFGNRNKGVLQVAGYFGTGLMILGGITKIEQGIAKRPTIQTMMKLADAFHITLDELVGRKIKS